MLASVGITAIVLMPPLGFAVLAGVVLTLGAWEWSRLAMLESSVARLALPLTIALAFGSLWYWASMQDYVTASIAGAMWWLGSLFWLAWSHDGGSAEQKQRAFKVLACGLSIVPAWCSLMWLRDQEHGPWWVLGLLVLVWAADILAYFTGKRFGKNKLAPSISPGKTREGAAGALLGAGIYGALVGHFALQLNWWAMAILAILTGAFSIVGDLLISLLKRRANVKDSGTLIPGHGGILDRFDSTLAATPVFVAGFSWLSI